MVYEEEVKQISKYNDSSFAISRLHDSWLKCRLLIRKGNFKQLRYELDLIWLELYPDITRQSEKDKAKSLIKNKKLMRKIAEAKTKPALFFSLMKRYEFLREIQDLAGKGGVYKDENEEDFE